jgi:hypothetical protein
MRNISREVFQAGFYEAQDVLAETDRVNLIDLQAGRAFRFWDRWQRRLLFRHASQSLAYVNPGLRRVIATCNNARDLMYVNAIDGWQERCKTSVCWLDEIWTADIPVCRELLRALRRFDHVFLNTLGTVGPLSDFLGHQCHPLPAATDTIRFSPLPNAVDVNRAVGWVGVHKALRAASEDGLFYVYDSYQAMAKMEPIDFKEHRDLYANMAKRSRYFMVSPAKMNPPEETRGQVEIGFRYFEGAAAGAVLIGQVPDCEPFRELFPWPDSVIQMRPDGSDTLDVLADLNSNPGRVRAISRRNAAESLLRHDWIHRWKTVFRHAGVEPRQGMTAREEHLKGLANAVLDATEEGVSERLMTAERRFAREAP